MALNVLRGRGRGHRSVIAQPVPIGDSDSDIFSCPICTRPLARGARRCPGCGTRLMLGVPAGRAALFAGVGLVNGLLIGAVAMAAVSALTRPQVDAGAGAAPVVVPSAAPAEPRPTTAPARPAEPAIPAMARSALEQATALHVRLATEAASLEVLLAANDLDAMAVARTIRSIASDAANGSSLAPRLAGWDDAAGLSADLATFYGQVRETARDGLRASVRNERAYRAAGEAMLAALAELPEIDARTRSLAEEAAGG